MSDRSKPDEAEDTGFQLLGLPQTGQEADLRSRTPVELLASQFVDELRQGERPSVETYAKRFPLHADTIRDSFPVLAMLEQARLQNEARAMRRSMPQSFPFTRLGGCELLCELGRGGMGVVFQAREADSGHVVAVKVLPWRVSMVPEWQSRFEEEARIAARMKHRNIVPVYRFGHEHGYCFYTMQFVNGVSLDRVINRLQQSDGVVYDDEIARSQQNRPDGFIPLAHSVASTQADVPEDSDSGRRRLSRTSWRSFTQIAMQVCDALRYAHQHDLLHNDIKPGNVLLDSTGRVMITDFGLSGSVSDSNAHNNTSVTGTLRYTAPERLSGTYDERSDLYSLGLTLYELLTLRPVFTGTSESDLIEQIQSRKIPGPRRVNSAVPAGLDRIVMNCIARRPENRYGSADELYADLLRYGRGQRVRSTRPSLWTLLRQQMGVEVGSGK